MRNFDLMSLIYNRVGGGLAPEAQAMAAEVLRQRERDFNCALYARLFFIYKQYTFPGAVSGETVKVETDINGKDMLILGAITNNGSAPSTTYLTNSQTKEPWSDDPVTTTAIFGHRYIGAKNEYLLLEIAEEVRAGQRLIMQISNLVSPLAGGTYYVCFIALDTSTGISSPLGSNDGLHQSALDSIRAGNPQRQHTLQAMIPYTGAALEEKEGETQGYAEPLLIVAVSTDLTNSLVQIVDITNNYSWSVDRVPILAQAGAFYDAQPYMEYPLRYYLPARGVLKLKAKQQAAPDAPGNVYFRCVTP